ncbi:MULTISPECIES: hypothetical protein [Dysgonomonas]|uniref:hypothetical protein n=1 Tax=Dysgonomonas TaxID=156973 RepID=UPI00092A2CEE|nr:MULTISPECIES: hypothetical protein [Dysgonomonas]MBN9302548.1 hypothetical protein [Dysgonomonas mossii]OJX59472.1 MAG: hypothetical protein BGO84_12020 [Dysgonomonas sp. 37-18]
MKTYKIVIISLLSIFIISSCQKTDLYEYPSSTDKAAEITSFSLVDINNENVIISSEIDTLNSVIKVVIYDGIPKDSLTPRAVVSEGVIVTPQMGVVTDFRVPVVYTLIAGDRSTKREWTVELRWDSEIEVDDKEDEYDSGFDYELDNSVWTLDASKSDDFNQLNTSLWSTSIWENTSGIFAYSASNVSVNNGKLLLNVAKEAKDGKEYTAGIIKSNFEIGEDTYVKIRAKVIHNKTNVNSFISLFGEPSASANPNTKITVMKTTLGAGGLSNSFVFGASQQIMPAGETAISSRVKYLNDLLSNDFHVFGIERRNGYIRLYIDGNLLWEFLTADYPELSNQLRSIILGIDGSVGGSLVDSQLPRTFKVDYVKVYNTTTPVNPPTEGANLILNPGFEAEGGNQPTNWTVKRTAGSEWALWAYQNDGYNGTTGRMVFTDGGAFDINVYQSLIGVETGVYRLEAWIRVRQGDFSTSNIYVKGYGGEERTVQSNGGSTWTRVVIDNVFVDNGTCEVGMHVITSGGNPNPAIDFDEFRFYKVQY